MQHKTISERIYEMKFMNKVFKRTVVRNKPLNNKCDSYVIFGANLCVDKKKCKRKKKA